MSKTTGATAEAPAGAPDKLACTLNLDTDALGSGEHRKRKAARHTLTGASPSGWGSDVFATGSQLGSPPNHGIDIMPSPCFSKRSRRFVAPRIRLHVAQLAENDNQNALPAEKRDERLTAPLLRLLPGGPGFIRLALRGP
jgi:hypothetical protein